MSSWITPNYLLSSSNEWNIHNFRLFVYLNMIFSLYRKLNNLLAKLMAFAECVPMWFVFSSAFYMKNKYIRIETNDDIMWIIQVYVICSYLRTDSQKRCGLCFSIGPKWHPSCFDFLAKDTQTREKINLVWKFLTLFWCKMERQTIQQHY